MCIVQRCFLVILTFRQFEMDSMNDHRVFLHTLYKVLLTHYQLNNVYAEDVALYRAAVYTAS